MSFFVCLAPDPVQEGPSTNWPVRVELTDSERKVLESGLLLWGGPAVMTDRIARVLWFESASDFRRERDRLGASIVAGHPLTPLDWHRVLAATEMVFASELLGAGDDWYVVTGLDEHETLDRLRAIQVKLRSVRPWPEPYARPGHVD